MTRVRRVSVDSLLGMPRRLLVLVAILAAGAASVSALVVGRASSDGPTLELRAQPIAPARPAPPTAGTGYDDRAVSVPRAGRPALVTFLFADCPDICPLVAQEISQALDAVGPRAGEIDVVAVSVDPSGDTASAVRSFLRRHRLVGRMDYIIGTRAELEPLWSSWFVAAQPENAPVSGHSARIVLIDRTGRQVGAYSAGIAIPIADLTADIRALIDS